MFDNNFMEVLPKKIAYKILILILLTTPLLFVDKTNRLRLNAIKNRFNYAKKYPKESYFAISVSEIVPCPDKSLNIAFFGQSNHGNIIKRNEKIDIPNKKVFIYDWRLGVCAKYREPIPGVDGTAGSYGHISTETVKYLQNKYKFNKNITIMGFSKGGSKANDWAQGVLSEKFLYIRITL